MWRIYWQDWADTTKHGFLACISLIQLANRPLVCIFVTLTFYWGGILVLAMIVIFCLFRVLLLLPSLLLLLFLL